MKIRGVVAFAAILAAAATARSQDGGQVIQGGATITNPNATTTQINQTTDRAILQWNNFSVASGNTVLFNQPSASSVVLNRVVGQNPSSILGSIQANGNVFLLNPNGIVFGQGSTVNANGFLASTLSMSDSDFMSGTYHLTQDPSQPLSYVVNQGAINAGSFAALVAPLVENSGSITAPGGTVYLLATSEAVLDLTGHGLVGYSIGNVSGGTVIIRPDALSDAVRAVVNTAGLVEAGQVVNNADGTVSLVGAGGTLVNTGTVSAKGIDGGGVILNSSLVSVLSSTSKLLSDGGLVEFSTKGKFAFGGTVETISPTGAVGEFLIDPNNITIAAGPGVDVNISFPGGGVITTSGNGATLFDTTVEALLLGGNVRIVTGTAAPNSEPGDIFINAAIDAPGTGTNLVLMAHRNIVIGADINFGGSTGSVVLRADSDSAGGGAIQQAGGVIRMGGGGLQLLAGSGIGTSVNPILTTGLQDVAATTFFSVTPIYIQNDVSGNVNVTTLNISPFVGATAGVTSFQAEVRLVNNAGDITVSSPLGHNSAGFGGAGLSFVAAPITVTAAGSIFVNSSIASGSLSDGGGSAVASLIQTASIVLTAGGSIIGNPQGQIITGSANVTGSGGGADQAISGSITLTIGGGGILQLAGAPAIQVGAANITGADGLDTATAGNLTLGTVPKISSDGATGRMLIVTGGANGGNTNNQTVISTTVNGGPGNIGGLFAQVTGSYTLAPLVTNDGNVDLRGINGDVILNGIDAGIGSISVSSTDLAGGGTGSLTLNGNYTSSASTLFAGGFLVVNPGAYNGGPVSMTGSSIFAVGVTSNSDVTMLATAGQVTMSLLCSADSWTITAAENAPSAPTFGNGITVFGNLIATSGSITLTAGDNILFQPAGGAHTVSSTGLMTLHAGFGDIDGVGSISQNSGGGLSTVSVGPAGQIVAIAESGIALGNDGLLIAGVIQALNITQGTGAGASGSVFIGSQVEAILADLTGAGSSVVNQGGPIQVQTFGNLTIAADVFSTSSIVMNTIGGLTSLINNADIVAGAGIAFTVGGLDGLFQNNGTIHQPAANVQIVADRVDLAAGSSISADGFNWVLIRPFTAGRGIDLGTGADPIGGDLGLSNAELLTIRDTTNGVYIYLGDFGFTSGPVTFTQDVALSQNTYLVLRSNGPITEIGGGRIATAVLEAVSNGGPVILQNPLNNVRFLIGQSVGDFVYANQGTLSISGFNVNGITSTGGNVTISTANGDIGIDRTIVATAGRVTMSAGGTDPTTGLPSWIGDFNGATTNINALEAVLIAQGGIGNTSIGNGAIEMNVGTLQAINLGVTGEINVVDLSGGLTLSALNPVSAAGFFNNAPGADVSITAVSFVTVASVSGGQANIILTAQSGGTSADNVNVNASLFSNGGNITLRAEDDIVFNMGGGGVVFTPLRLQINAAFNDLGGGGGSIFHTSGSIVVNELVAVSENGISLGVTPGTSVNANRLQAINGGNLPAGNVDIVISGNVEVFGITGGMGLVNAALTGAGHLSLTTSGTMTLTNDVFAVGDVTLNGGPVIVDNACITTINGTITLNGTAYPSIGYPNVILGPASCFHVFGPADYIQVLFDGDPNTNLQLVVSSNVSVLGRIILLSEGDIVINGGVTLSSSLGIIAMADFEGFGSDGVGAISAAGATLRTNEFTLSAATGITVVTQSFNPLAPALMQIRNARFDGANNGSTISVSHTGDLSLGSTGFLDAGAPSVFQDSNGSTTINATGSITVQNLPGVADDILVRGSFFSAATGAGVTFDNEGTIRSLQTDNTQYGFIVTVNGAASLFVNNGTITAPQYSFVEGFGNDAIVINNGLIDITANSLDFAVAAGTNQTILNDIGGTLRATGYARMFSGGTNTQMINNGVMNSTGSGVYMDGGAGSFATNNGLMMGFGGRISADRISLLGGTILVHEQDFFTLQAATAGRPILLGNVGDGTPGALEISDAEIDRIQPSFGGSQFRLIIGNQGTGGPITITNPITAQTTGPIGALVLESGANNITQLPGAFLVVPNHLTFITNGAVTLTEPLNDALQLTATVNGAFTYTDANDIAICSFGGDGVFTNNHNVTISTINGPISFGLVQSAPPFFQFGGGPINAGSATVRLTAGGPNGSIWDAFHDFNAVPDITAGDCILVANAGIGGNHTAQNYLEVQVNRLQAINTGTGGQSYIEVIDNVGGLTIEAIDTGVSTFGARNSAPIGLVSIFSADGPLTVLSPIQANYWIWLQSYERTLATNDDIIIRANLTAPVYGIYLWAGDNVFIGQGATNPVLTTNERLDLMPTFGDTDLVGALTQFSGTISGASTRVQAANGISLGALGGSTFSTGRLAFINVSHPQTGGTTLGIPTGNIVVNNSVSAINPAGNLVLDNNAAPGIEGFGPGVGLMNNATGVPDGNISISTPGTLSVNSKLFGVRNVTLNGGSIVVNAPIHSVTGPILLNGINYPVAGNPVTNGSVTDNTNGAFQIYSPGVAPSVIVVYADHFTGTDFDVVYNTNQNVAGSIVIISEGDITIAPGTTLRAAGGIILVSDWEIANPNGQGAIFGAGATLQTNLLVATAAQGIQLTTQSLTFNGTTQMQIVNSTSGNVRIDHTGNVVIDHLDRVLNDPLPAFALGLATVSGNLDFSATGNITLNAGVQNTGGGLLSLTAGINILDDGLATTFIASGGPVFLTATNGSIGTGDLSGAVTTGYVDVSLGGVGTLTATAAGNLFIQEIGAGTALNTSQLLVFTSTGSGHTLGLSSLTGDVNLDASFGAGQNNLVVTGNNIAIGGSAIVSSEDRVTLTSLGTITEAAGGLLRSRQLVLSATGDITLPGTQVSQLQVLNGNNVTITNVGDIVLMSIVPGDAVDVNGDFSLTARSSITVAAPVTAVSIALSADENISVLLTGRLDATGPGGSGVNLTATTGSITITGDSTTTAPVHGFGGINLHAGSTISVVDTASTPTFTLQAGPGGGIDMLAQGDITLNGVFFGTNVDIQTFGDFTAGGRLQAGFSTVQVFAAGTLSADAFFIAPTGITLEGIHGVTLVNGGKTLTSSAGPIDIEAVSGSILLGEATTGRQVTLNAGTTIDLQAAITSTDLLTGFTTVTAGGTITLGAPIVATAGNNQTVTLTSATGSIIDGNAGALNVSTRTLIASAPGGIALDANVLFFNGTSTNGNVSIVNSVGMNALVNAPQGTATITLLTGLLSGTVTAQNAVLTGPAGIALTTTVGTLTATSTAGDISITETDDLALNLVSALGLVSINAGGAITDANGAAMNIVGGSALLQAANGIGTWSDPLETQLSNLTFQNSTVGDVSIANSGDLFLATSFNNGGRVGVSVTGEFDVQFGNLTASGDIVLSSTLQLALFNESVQAGGSVTITTLADLAIGASDVVALDGNLTLSAGTIGPVTNVFLSAGDAGSGLGNISISSLGDVNLTAASVFSSRNTTITATDTIFSNQSFFNVGGTLTMTADFIQMQGDGVLGSPAVLVLGDITMNAGLGILLQNIEVVTAATVRLNAQGTINQTGVGDIDGTALVTHSIGGTTLNAVSAPLVQAGNTISGNISITGTGTLTLSDVDGLGWAVRNLVGTTTVTTPGTLTLTGLVDGGSQPVTLTGASILDGNGPALNLVAGAATLTGNTIEADTAISTLTASGGSVTIRQAGTLTVNTVAAGPAGSVQITLASGAILDGNGAATNITTGSLVLSAPGGINLDTAAGSLTAVSVNNDITIREADGLVVNSIVAGSGTLTLSAAGALTDGNGTANNITAFRAVLSTVGGLGTAADPLDLTVGHLSAQNSGAGDLSVVNTGDLVVERATSGTGGVILAVQGGTLTIQGDGNAGTPEVRADGNVSLSASGDIVFQNASVDTNTDMTIATTANLSFVNSIFAINGRMTLHADGSILQTGGTLTANELVLRSALGTSLGATDVNFLQASNTVSGNLVIINGGTLTLSDLTGLGWSVRNDGGGIDLRTGGATADLTVNGGVVSAGTLTLGADRSIVLNGSLTSSGTLTLTADRDANGSGGISQTAGGISAPNLILNAGQNIGPLSATVGRLSATSAGGDIVFTNSTNLIVDGVSAPAGNVFLTLASGTLTDGNGTGVNVSGLAAFLTAPGGMSLDVAVGQLSATSTNSPITLRETGSLTLVSINSGLGDITLTVSGNITDGTAGVDFTGNTLTLTAGTGLGVAGGNVLELNVNTVNATVTGTGSIGLSNVGALTVNQVSAANGSVDITALAGTLTVEQVSAAGATSDIALTASGGGIFQTASSAVVAGRNITLSSAAGVLLGLVDAGGTATVTAANGSILDNNDFGGEVLNIRTGGIATLTATGVVGTLFNCIEVEIGGNLTINAGGSIAGVSASVCGTVNGITVNGPAGTTYLLNQPVDPLFLQSERASVNDLLEWWRQDHLLEILQYPITDYDIWTPVPVTDERDKKKTE